MALTYRDKEILVRIWQDRMLYTSQIERIFFPSPQAANVRLRRLWENGYVESFNGKLRDELLNRELFLSLTEARYVLDEWRLEYNHRRPHSGIGWQTPTAYAACCEREKRT